MTEPRLCRNPDCRKPIDPDRVEAYDATCCPGDTCRAAARRDEVGYNAFAAQARSQPRLTANPGRSRKSRGSGRQVSYLKAVAGCFDALVECGVDRDEAELLAEKHMRAKLSAKQLAELEASEREYDEPEPAPMVLPMLVPAPPAPESAPDLPPAAEDEPHVRIYQRQRGEYDELIWVEVDQMPWRGKPEVALQIWLADADPEPLPGGYKAVVSGGAEAETVHGSEAA